jgi:hypothetical protein
MPQRDEACRPRMAVVAGGPTDVERWRPSATRLLRTPTTSSRHRASSSWTDFNRYGIWRFITCTDSVAAPRSKVAGEMFLATTRTVLLDHAAASSSMKRVDDASAA